MKANVYVGIDVSKERLDIGIAGENESWEVSNDPEGIRKLRVKMGRIKPAMIVMEASGGFEREVYYGMLEAGYPTVVVNPTRVRHYAKAIGQYAKTDQIDAQVIACFGKDIPQVVRPVQTDEQERLAALLARRKKSF